MTQTMFFVILIPYLCLLAWAWRRVLTRTHHSHVRTTAPDDHWRSTAARLALCLVTVSTALLLIAKTFPGYLGWENVHIGFPLLSILGLWLSIAALVLAAFSKRWRRTATLILSTVALFVWSVVLIFGGLG